MDFVTKEKRNVDTLFIVIPAYNESENIKDLIEEWYPVVEKVGGNSKLLIVDDGSKDSTYAVASECRLGRGQLEVCTKENQGHGATVLWGYQYALDQGADYVFQTDSDRQTCPDEFWQFWEMRNQYDLIIGNRNSREDGISRILVTKVLKFVVWICFGVWAADVNTPFRLMKAEGLKENLVWIPDQFNLSNVVLTVLYMKRNYGVKFIPITFKARQKGTNSINLRRIAGIGVKALKDFRTISKSLGRMKKGQIS